MVIDRIGNINKIVGSDNARAKNVRETQPKTGEDTVSISKEAQQAQELSKATATVKQTPDIRQDRVNEVKEKMARGEYDNPDGELLSKVAEKIAEALVRP